MVKLIANGWAWRWCLPKWVAIPGRATSLEPQAMSRVHRLPQQLCTRPPPTRHRHTDQVSGDTYQPHTYWIRQWGREGKGEKAEQQKACCLKQTAPHTAETTSTQAIRETLYVTSVHMVPWPPLTWLGLILTEPKLHLATFKCLLISLRLIKLMYLIGYWISWNIIKLNLCQTFRLWWVPHTGCHVNCL